MKRLHLIALWGGLILCGLITPVHAQNRPDRFSPQKFVKELEGYIIREAGLSRTEAAAFFPIFHELHNKQRSINWQINELKKRNLPGNATDKDYNNIIRKINKLKVESAELEDTYYRKMCKAVPARKVHAAMKAEDSFHRRMLHRFSTPEHKRVTDKEKRPGGR